MSYVHALVYHDRNPSEHTGLHETIEASVATDEHRQEVTTMRRSIADMFREEGMRLGEVRARRLTLLRLLRKRFGEVPRALEDVIEASEDIEQLDNWLDRFATAKALSQVGILPPA